MKDTPTKPNQDSYLEQLLANVYTELARSNCLPSEPVISNPNHPHCTVEGKNVTSFCSNSYLGLGTRREVRDAAIDGIVNLTHSTSESRRLGGNFQVLELLERRLAAFKAKPACLVTATGLLANIAAIHGIADTLALASRWHEIHNPAGQVVTIMDSLSHQSLRMGARLSTSRRLRYRHNDVDHLDELLIATRGHPVIVATDGVFSMDGDLAPIPAISTLCQEHGALLLVDDAHGTGVYGREGRGTVSHFGLENEVPVIVATLSKSLAAMGGAVLASVDIIELLKTFAAGYRFTSSLPAEQAMAVLAALNIVENEPDILSRLWANVRVFRTGLQDLDIRPVGEGPIVVLRCNTAADAYQYESELLKRGLWCPAVVPPAVPPTACRVRLVITAAHSREQIGHLLNAIAEIESSPMLPSCIRSEGSHACS